MVAIKQAPDLTHLTAARKNNLTESQPDEIDLSQWRSDTTNSGYMHVYKKKCRSAFDVSLLCNTPIVWLSCSGKFEAFSHSSPRLKKYLGVYSTAEEAATAVARSKRKIAGKTPKAEELSPPAPPLEQEPQPQPQQKPQPSA